MNILRKVLPIALIAFSFSSVADVAIVVNKANTHAIDTELVKRIYLGKVKSFPSGGKVTVLSLGNENEETQKFRQTILKKSSSQYKSYWSKLVFTGKGKPPKELASSTEVINAVKTDANAIGFVASSSVSDDVKVITTF